MVELVSSLAPLEDNLPKVALERTSQPLKGGYLENGITALVFASGVLHLLGEIS